MQRLLLEILIPVFAWGSLGLWGLAFCTLLRGRDSPLVLTPGLVFRAIACGPIAFFINWRKAMRSDATRERKRGQE
jgi:hypothetical protein